MTFSYVLKQLLAKYEFNQRRLAAAANLDGGQLSRLMKGANRPALETVERICTALNCTDDERLELCRVAGRMPQEIMDAFRSDPLMARVFRMFAQMGVAEVEKVVVEFNQKRRASR